MRKLISIFLITVTIVSITGFKIATNYDNNCSSSMEGGNPQRTNSYPNCQLGDSRLYQEIVYKDINKDCDSFILLCATKDKLVYFRRKNKNSEMSCLDVSTKDVLWTKYFKYSYQKNDVVIYNRKIFYLTSPNKKQLICCDLLSGKKQWSIEIQNRNHYRTSLLVCEQGLYLGYNDNSVEHYDVADGSLIWDNSLDIPNTSKNNQHFTPAIIQTGDDILFLNVGLYCLSSTTGQTKWSITEIEDYDEPLTAEYMFASGDTLLIRKNEYSFLCIDLNTRNIRWIANVDIYVDPLFMFSLSDNLLFIGPYTIDTISGKEVWEDSIDKFSYRNTVSFSDVILVNENRKEYGTAIIKLSNRRVLWKHSTTFGVPIIISGNPYYVIGNDLIKLSPAADSLTFKINSNTYNPDNDEAREMDSEPVIKDGRTLLPAKYVTEPLGGQVFWDGEQRKVTCKLVAPDNSEYEEYKENIVELWIGKSTAKVNGVEVQIDPNNPDVVPTIINDRTMVPMRFLAESLGCEVEWLAETKEIILTYSP